jgi:hypothetical protein
MFDEEDIPFELTFLQYCQFKAAAIGMAYLPQ